MRRRAVRPLLVAVFAAIFLLIPSLVAGQGGDSAGTGIRLVPDPVAPGGNPAGPRLLAAALDGSVTHLWTLPADQPAATPAWLGEVEHRPGYGIALAARPDGAWLAIVRVPDGRPAETGGRLAVADLATGNSRDLAGGIDPRVAPHWSPDGRTLLVDRLVPAGPDRQMIEIVLIAADGAATTLLVTQAGSEIAIGSIGWSANGQVLFYRLGPAGSELWEIDPATRSERFIARLSDGPIALPALSPDGHRVAFGTRVADAVGIEEAVLAADTASGQMLTVRTGAAPFWFAWQGGDRLVTGSAAAAAEAWSPAGAPAVRSLEAAPAVTAAPGERWLPAPAAAAIGVVRGPAGVALVDAAGTRRPLPVGGYVTAVTALGGRPGGELSGQPGTATPALPSPPPPAGATLPPAQPADPPETEQDDGMLPAPVAAGPAESALTLPRAAGAAKPASLVTTGPEVAPSAPAGSPATRPATPSVAALAARLSPFGPAPIARAAATGDADRCAQTGAMPYQPTLAEVNTVLERAATARLGAAYPQMARIGKGWPDVVSVSPSVPCVLLKAIAYVESGWRQADYSVPRGSSGVPLINAAGCAYGVGQIASGMANPGDLAPDLQYRIANDYVTNIAYSAKVLADKWRITPAVGSNDPAIAEDWYYAVWAYNGFDYWNNPNNPRWDPARPPFNGTQSYLTYPYQELVWGFAANPPAPGGQRLWVAVPLTLPAEIPPDSSNAANAGRIPADPQPVHTSTCPAVSITRSPDTLTFYVDAANPAPQQATVTLRDPFGASFAWRAESSAAWLTPGASSGSGLPADLLLTIAPQSLGRGAHSASVLITSPDGTFQSLTVRVDVIVTDVQRTFFPGIFRSSG